MGVMHVQLEQTKKKLEKMGVFDVNKKKKIPLVPKKIAVVTSLTAAALQDIIHIAERRYPVCNIEVYPAQCRVRRQHKLYAKHFQLLIKAVQIP